MTDMGAPLDFDSIIEEARQRAGGLEDFGDGPFEGPLQRLIDSLDSDGRLNAIGRTIAKERILGHTVNRLNYVNDRKTWPEIADEKIARPVFIVGMPRTGTTILHDILAVDPDSKAPMTWETVGQTSIYCMTWMIYLTVFPSRRPRLTTLELSRSHRRRIYSFPAAFLLTNRSFSLTKT